MNFNDRVYGLWNPSWAKIDQQNQIINRPEMENQRNTAIQQKLNGGPRMKLLKALLLGLACASTASMVFASNPPEPEAIKVGFCELYQHPESYAGKLVQVHGIIYGIKHMRIEDASYPGTRCESYVMIGFLIPKGPSGPHAPVRDAAFDSLEAGIESGKRVIADVQGFFELQPKDAGPGVTPAAQLVLFKASNVVTLPVPRK